MKPSAYELSLVGDRYLGVPYEKMDCQAFVEACLRDVGIKKDLSGCNAWYRAMTWSGSPDQCKAKFGEIPKGAFLFIHSHDGKEPDKYKADGLGNASHMGIYTGRGKGAINSSYSRGCVCESEFQGKAIPGGWNIVGLWNALSYGTEIDDILNGKKETKPMKKAIVLSENGKGVNFRERKTIYSRNFGTIPEGAEVDILEELGEWDQIEYNGKTGYAMSKFLTVVADEEAEFPGGINGDKVVLTLDSDLAWALYILLKDALGEDGAVG